MAGGGCGFFLSGVCCEMNFVEIAQGTLAQKVAKETRKRKKLFLHIVIFPGGSPGKKATMYPTYHTGKLEKNAQGVKARGRVK